MDALTVTEQSKLDALEKVIEKNLLSFIKVGNALLQIRESRLYRKTHEAFEDYCRDRWEMTHQHADRLIGSAKVITHLTPIGVKPTNAAQVQENLSTMVDTQPGNERQVRPLTQLDPELQREAWTKAVECLQL